MGRDSAVTQSACTTEENSWAMVQVCLASLCSDTFKPIQNHCLTINSQKYLNNEFIHDRTLRIVCNTVRMTIALRAVKTTHIDTYTKQKREDNSQFFNICTQPITIRCKYLQVHQTLHKYPALYCLQRRQEEQKLSSLQTVQEHLSVCCPS